MHFFLRNFRTNLTPVLLRLFAAVLLLGIVLAQTPVPNVQAQAPLATLTLTKTVDGGVTTAKVGDVIFYRIHFACSSLTTDCGAMEITDVLQDGLIYKPPPDSSVPSGYTMSYDSPTRTIKITHPLMIDGSQADAVIAVQVDYDLRPLPADINNTATGQIMPPGTSVWLNSPPALAPTISIGTVTPSWGLTKTLYRPSINPTINTDVTYRIQLCPTTPPVGQGNTPLLNIVITDTMPVGAVFVSASDSGDGLTSPGTVTWPVIAGPIYPPSCVTRYVTIRYNGPPAGTFSIGNSVTNSASANGFYTDSSGVIGPVGTITDPIIHPIAPIVEVPTYSKNDQGDPIGLTATGRFVLNLNTNATNYPSNSLILIDNLPPELQVTSVTSGQWASSFNYVRAHVEYSTDNGSSYMPFPDPPVPPAIEQPAGYNTNATYTAPVTTITNVRWRFEYDPTPNAIPPFSFTQAGLPYGWAFTTSPQIRVTPRAVAVVGPPLLPAAVAGSTYTNCLQVSRVSSTGPVVDACDNETMTVQGDVVSLRVSKAETMGTAWDEVSDPLINTFASDGNLLPGDTLRYTITVEVTERSSTSLISPTILDTFPADLVFVRNGTAQVSGTGCPALATQPIFSQPAVDQLQWDFPSLTLNRPPSGLGSCTLTVQFFARIPPGQTPGARTNTFQITNSTTAVCETGTPVGTTGCQRTDNYTVERSAALRGEKWIRSTDALNSQVVDAATFLPPAVGSCPNGGTVGLPGGGSNPFTRYPCISQAFPDGALNPGQIVPPPVSTTLDDFEYNLRIFNDGNVPMLRYVLYDILPYIGDTGSGGTLASSPRNSEFRPRLRGPIVFISGPGGLTAADFIIQYNATTNPCRPEVFDQPTGSAVPAGCNNTWTTDWSTSARSFRIRLDDAKLPAPVIANAVPAGQELRFGVPMNIPAPAGGADDALSHEIAWNSFAHVGSYDKALVAPVVIQDLLASEPRKVGITVPEVMSVGNRVWRDSDNSGTINAPDDLAPGIAGVTVNLYRDVDNNGIADGPAIAATTTDGGGYYLFSNIPYDSAVMNNNRYLIGIPASNFGPAPTAPLFNLRSSTGTPAVPAYTDPPSNNADQDDNGRDPSTPGLEVFSANFILQPGTEPTAEADLSANNRDGPAGARRGVNGERNNNSDLTLDFGFFGGTDVPFSLGNHIWYDDGYTAPGVFNYAFNNDGIRQSTELPVVGVMVRLYRDGDANGILIPAEMIRTDLTDTNGFYLFDNLDPGPYYVEIPATEFAAGKPLSGWNSSQTTGTENTGVPGNTNTPNMDSDDNGVDTASPETNGVFSGVIVLTRGVNEQTVETHLSNQPDPDSNPATPNLGINPTEWDGPNSRGRYGETDITSNLTIDFGFFPVYSLGNRVWNDNGANPGGGGVADDGIRNGDEPGINGVTVNLYRDSNDNGVPDGGIIATMNTAGGGYYRFDNLMADTYIVEIVTPAGYASSPVDAGDPDVDADDNDDNGVILVMSGAKIRSNPVTLGRGTDEPENDDDPTPGPESGEAADDHSNRTVDFALTTGYSLGNRVWYDTNNDGAFGVVEEGINGVRVNLYRDTNSNGVYDGGDIFVGFETTDVDGYYRFDGLLAGGYVVVIPADNFRNIGAGDTVAGNPLAGYLSSGTSIAGTGAVSDSFGPDPDTTVTDSDDNGVSSFTSNRLVYVSAQAVTLGGLPLEPTGEEPSPNPAAGEAPDDHSDRTVDFGFYRLQLSNQIFVDINSDGTYVASDDTPLAGAKVQLYASDDITEILVGPDGILSTADDAAGGVTTLAGGVYLFGGLPAGNYIVKVTPLLTDSTSTITASGGDTTDPNTNTDNNDNGIGEGTGQVSSGIVTLTPGQGTGGVPGAANNTVTDSTGTTSNPTLDFGFTASPLIGVAKRVVGTPALVSPGTWDVTFTILVKNYGNVTLSNVQVTDDLANPDAAPSTFPPLAAYTVTGISTSSNLTANAGYNGNSDTRLLDPATPNQLDPDEEGTITLVVRVVPTKSSENTAIASGEPPVGDPVTDNSQDGVDPDPAPKDGNPTNDNVPTPVNFGPGLFDPPIGFKVFDNTGLPMLQWTMTWINSTNITAVNVRVSDPIPAGTTFAPGTGLPNIYPVPLTAPSGSTNVGISCTTPAGSSTITTQCYYEAPTTPPDPAYPLGRIVWEGTLGPDFGHLTAATAVNELDITFSVTVPSEVRTVYNVATVDTDRNGDGTYIASEERLASVQALWAARGRGGHGEGTGARQLPATGFAPGVVTILPEQPADKAYFDTGTIWLEIPRLGINTSIVGIPQADDGTWDVSWLWGQAGWLQGTAYPTASGNSVVTAHVYLPNGKPGPFVDVNKLSYGDKIIVHAYGHKYTYEVRENKQVRPNNVSVLKREDKAWLTLLTCLGYNESNNTYASRVAVRAALMTVEEDTSTQNKNR